jgi:hypothetical protein
MLPRVRVRLQVGFLSRSSSCLLNSTRHRLVKRVRAWCPNCLRDQKSKKTTIYEQLTWALTAMNVCAGHAIKLETKCPHCQRTSSPFMGRLIPGRCSRCLGWLGSSSGPSAREATDNQYELWVADQLGQLIAGGFNPDSCPTPQRFSDFLSIYANQVCRGNTTESARFLGISLSVWKDWRSLKRLPNINFLLRIISGSSYCRKCKLEVKRCRKFMGLTISVG